MKQDDPARTTARIQRALAALVRRCLAVMNRRALDQQEKRP